MPNPFGRLTVRSYESGEATSTPGMARAARNPNIPIGMKRPIAIVTMLTTSTAAPTRANRLATSSLSR